MFTVIEGSLGAAPLAPGWARWRLAPQPSTLASIAAAVPTPGGMVALTWTASALGGARNATVTLTVLAGQAAQVCLPVPPPALPGPATTDVLRVDGVAVAAPVPWGRLLCTTSDLAPGAHVVERVTAAAP